MDLEQVSISVQAKSDALLNSVLKFRVIDFPTLAEAGLLSKNLSQLEAEIRSTFDPVISDADKLHKKLLAQRAKHLTPITAGISYIKNESKRFLIEDERRRKEEEERQERERIEAELKEREARIKIALEKQLAEEARLKAQQEADRLLNEAAEKELQGLKEESDALLSKAVEVTPEPATKPLHNIGGETIGRVYSGKDLTPAIRSVPGLGSRKIWKWRVSNKTLIPREYLTTNEILLNALCRTLKQPDDIAGIEFYEDIEMRRKQ